MAESAATAAAVAEEDDDPFAVFSSNAPPADPSLSPALTVPVAQESVPAPSPSPPAFMSVVCASSADGAGSDQSQRPRAAVMREPMSGIRVSRPTRDCEQLSLVLVQHPFCAFSEARTRLAASGASLTVVGVVARRTDPKQSGAGRAYGVVTLWNMRGPFATPPDEFALLIAGAAFDVHYARLVTGVVLAVSGAQRLQSNGNGNGNGKSDALHRVAAADQVRVLGHASDLATCSGSVASTGERCSGIVNAAVSQYCARHVSSLRTAARGIATKPNATRPPSKPLASVPLGSKPLASVPLGSKPLASVPLGSKPLASVPLGSKPSPLVGLGSKPSPLVGLGRAGFLTVRGARGLPAAPGPAPGADTAATGGGPYAGVARGGASPTTPLCESPPQQPPAASIGVTGRGRAVLAAAAAQAEARATAPLLRRALYGDEPAGKKRTRAPAEESAAAVREAFAPLSRDGATAFAPLRSHFSEVRAAAPDVARRIVPGKGATGAVVAAVAQSLRGGAALAAAKAQPAGPGAPASLLARVAGEMHSVNDALRTEDAARQFERRTERRLAQDKAIAALEEVTEQRVTAVHCRECNRWYSRRNELCRKQQHTLVFKETMRRFIECEHCGYKTFVLGDTHASKLIPRCPRCNGDVLWKKSNAAPEAPSKKTSD